MWLRSLSPTSMSPTSPGPSLTFFFEISLPATIALSPPLRQSRQLHHVLALYPEFYRTSPRKSAASVLSSTLLIGIPPKFIPKLGGRCIDCIGQQGFQTIQEPTLSSINFHASLTSPKETLMSHKLPHVIPRHFSALQQFQRGKRGNGLASLAEPLPVFPHALRKTHLNPQDTEALDVLPATYFAQRLIHFIRSVHDHNARLSSTRYISGTVSDPFFSRAQQYPILFKWSRFPYMEKFCSPSPFGTAFNAPSYRIKRLKDVHLASWHFAQHRLAFRLDMRLHSGSRSRTASECRKDGILPFSHISESSELPKNRGRALSREKKYRSRDVESVYFVTIQIVGSRKIPFIEFWVEGSLLDSWNLQLLQVTSKKWAAKPHQPSTMRKRDLVYSPTAGCSSNLPLSAKVLIQNCGLIIENSAAGYLPHIILVSRKINFPIINNNILCTTTTHPPKCPLSSRPMTTRNPKERPGNGDSNSFNKRQLMLIGGSTNPSPAIALQCCGIRNNHSSQPAIYRSRTGHGLYLGAAVELFSDRSHSDFANRLKNPPQAGIPGQPNRLPAAHNKTPSHNQPGLSGRTPCHVLLTSQQHRGIPTDPSTGHRFPLTAGKPIIGVCFRDSGVSRTFSPARSLMPYTSSGEGSAGRFRRQLGLSGLPHTLPAEVTLPCSLTLGLLISHADLHVGDAKVKWFYPFGGTERWKLKPRYYINVPRCLLFYVNGFSRRSSRKQVVTWDPSHYSDNQRRSKRTSQWHTSYLTDSVIAYSTHSYCGYKSNDLESTESKFEVVFGVINMSPDCFFLLFKAMRP
ncbi:uncharacterized protein CLUP02_15284 [Colletotrichum lupini]|uniref:Uncharacterized protein n=1 Tax=Colletotrichum lupini TaxID=145971 RepID=A0A9Q8WN53_9PEZI|nr:uncharacterized protein CLUP02_15284 [Colletotrichum lupini]UQC89753.1 hypothetical protein CLUP02_15284 [Colletotrichum lupini]